MNSRDFRNKLASATPEVPEHFHNRVEMTLENIVTQEGQMKKNTKQAGRKAGRFSRRMAAIALALVLALAAAAFAATQWHIFENTEHLTGEGTPVNADSIMQRDLHRETVNGVEITVLEAGYDGRTLLLQYSFRMTDVDRAFGRDGLTDEDIRLLNDHHVGWWQDQIWFDGRAMDMPEGSENTLTGSDVPGEIIETDVWRLDNEDVTLDGPVQISLPIGEQQPLSDFTRAEHPEKYDEEGNMKLPEKGIVTFTYTTGDIRQQVQTVWPGTETTLPEGKVRVAEASFTPLMTYIKVEMEADPEALAAFMADNGEEDEETAGMALFEDWLFSLQLTDSEGNPIETEGSGLDGYCADRAEFLFAWQEDLPGELWLAPADDETADMSRAVLVRPAE